MPKVALIGFANIYAMPYANKYIKVLKENNIEYDFIFWDRENICEKADNYYSYKETIDSSLHITKKLLSFYRYYKYVLSILKKNKYDKIIVLYTIPAILLQRYLTKYYRKKYIFAYTDYTFENNKCYKKALAKVVKNSYITTVTSHGFSKYLPKNDNIIIAHNIEDLCMTDDYSLYKKPPITISYIGMLRNFNHIIKLINIFKNDNRFVLKFHGNGFCEEELRNYIKNNNIENVFVYGKYQPVKKKQLVKDCDIINNSFANDIFQKYAMTNRMYDAVLNKKPQITTNESYTQEIVEKYNLGFVIDFNDFKIKEKIYDWYYKINYKNLFYNCEKYYNIVKKDIEKLEKEVEIFLNKK